jgi:DHA1 family bicyclomycin/chloramphenicol resistance-like MFS transporter
MLVVLGGLSAFGPLSTDMYLPGLPSMAADLGVRPSVAQLTLSACLIGLAVGQLLAGPISDALGRRRPLLFGLVSYIVASVLCAVSPSIVPLLALRFIQGLAGAAGITIARAVVRDRSEGVSAARAYALLMIVGGLGPVVAPIAGGLLLHVTDWRGVFATLAGIGLLLLLAAGQAIDETLPDRSRHRGGLRTTGAAISVLIHDRRFVANTLTGSFAFGTLMAWIASAPFVLERIHGLSPQLFSVVFAANGTGILLGRQIASSQLNRLGPARVLSAAVLCQCVGAVGVLGATVAGLGLLPLLICLFIATGSVGGIMPMSIALAMNDHPLRAGSASGVLGFVQFLLGSAVAPLVGIAGPRTALPMAIAMPVCALAALFASRLAQAAPRHPAALVVSPATREDRV